MGHIFEQSPINILTKEKFMSKKVWLCSKFDCLVKKQEQVFLKAQVTKVCLELEDDDCFFVYPIGDGISYMVTMQNGQIVDNGHVLIEKLFDDEYSVVLLPFFCMPISVQRLHKQSRTVCSKCFCRKTNNLLLANRKYSAFLQIGF